MAISSKWKYINIFEAQVQRVSWKTDQEVEAERKGFAGFRDYITVVNLPRLLVVQFARLDSLHIWIHKSLIK